MESSLKNISFARIIVEMNIIKNKKKKKRIKKMSEKEKVNKIILEIPEEMLKSEKYEDFREELFSLINKWNLRSSISNGNNKIKII